MLRPSKNGNTGHPGTINFATRNSTMYKSWIAPRYVCDRGSPGCECLSARRRHKLRRAYHHVHSPGRGSGSTAGPGGVVRPTWQEVVYPRTSSFPLPRPSPSFTHTHLPDPCPRQTLTGTRTKQTLRRPTVAATCQKRSESSPTRGPPVGPASHTPGRLRDRTSRASYVPRGAAPKPPRGRAGPHRTHASDPRSARAGRTSPRKASATLLRLRPRDGAGAGTIGAVPAPTHPPPLARLRRSRVRHPGPSAPRARTRRGGARGGTRPRPGFPPRWDALPQPCQWGPPAHSNPSHPAGEGPQRAGCGRHMRGAGPGPPFPPRTASGSGASSAPPTSAPRPREAGAGARGKGVSGARDLLGKEGASFQTRTVTAEHWRRLVHTG